MRPGRRTPEQRARDQRLANVWLVWLQRLGLSIRDISRAVGINVDVVRRYLGSEASPHAETLTKIRTACDARYPGGVDDARWQAGPEWVPEPVAETPRNLPRSRSECRGGPRPCPYFSCPHNTLIEYQDGVPIVASGGAQVGRPGTPGGHARSSEQVNWDAVEEKLLAAWERSGNNCAKDLEEAGGATLDQVAAELQVTREGARQIEARALVRSGLGLGEWRGHLADITRERISDDQRIWG